MKKHLSPALDITEDDGFSVIGRLTDWPVGDGYQFAVNQTGVSWVVSWEGDDNPSHRVASLKAAFVWIKKEVIKRES